MAKGAWVEGVDAAVNGSDDDTPGDAPSAQAEEKPEPRLAPLHSSFVAQRQLHAFAAFVEATQGTVRVARCPGFDTPRVVEGTLSSQRPDMVGSAYDHTPFVAEAVAHFEIVTPEMHMRWQLLNSYAAAHGAHVYWLVATFEVGCWLRAVLEQRGIRCHRIFVVDLV